MVTYTAAESLGGLQQTIRAARATVGGQYNQPRQLLLIWKNCYCVGKALTYLVTC